jgi:signal transduction histidine kinase
MASAPHLEHFHEPASNLYSLPAPTWSSLDPLRVARELHDVGGVVAAIEVHAGLALKTLERRPAEAAEALRTITVASRRALDEMNWLLSTLRLGRHPERADERTLAQVDALVSVVLAGRVKADVTVSGHLRRLPAAVDEAAYNIVQEALTNVIRHSDATDVRLSIECEGHVLHVAICDNGAGPGDHPWRPGNGIAGMRERAESLGGHLTTERRPGTGFRVIARLPFVASS